VGFDDPTFWQGAGAVGITGIVAVWVRKLAKRESLEDRLQRWQESTVASVRAENQELRREVTGLEREVATLNAKTGRVDIVEACLRLSVEALARIAPGAPELRQIAVLLSKAVPIDPDVPDDMRAILARIRRTGEDYEN